MRDTVKKELEKLFKGLDEAVAKGDDEVAHITEKEIWRTALDHIANGEDDSQDIATMAAKTNEYVFSRWFA